MRHLLFIPAMAALLAGCGGNSTSEGAQKTGEVSLTNASVPQVAQQAAAAGPARLRPGKWETTVEVSDIDMPGVPAGPMREQMQSMMQSSQRTITTCITPDQAANPQSDVFTGRGGHTCKYDRFSMVGGHLDAMLSCTGPNGGMMTQKLSGSFTPDAFTLESEVHNDRAAGGAGMTMKARTSGKRVGDCDS